jgi:hypothetical protein
VNRGVRVELTDATGYDAFKLSAGDRGTVEFTDSLRTIHIRWANGRRAGIINPGRGPDPRHPGSGFS